MVKAESRTRWHKAMTGQTPTPSLRKPDLEEIERQVRAIGKKRRRPMRAKSPAPEAIISPPSVSRVSKISPPTDTKREKKRSVTVVARRSLPFSTVESEPDIPDVDYDSKKQCLEQIGMCDPDEIPFIGREHELEELLSFFRHERSRAKRPLVLVGPPGSGKSSSVDRSFKQFVSENPSSLLVTVNCNVFDSPEAVYYHVKEEIRQHLGWCLPQFRSSAMHSYLNSDRINKLQTTIVVVLDELDDLIARDSKARCATRRMLSFLAQLTESKYFKCVGIMNDLLVFNAIAQQLLEHDNHVLRSLVFRPYEYQVLRQLMEAHVEYAIRDVPSLQVKDLCPDRALELLARKMHTHAHADARHVQNTLASCVDIALERLDALPEGEKQPEACVIQMNDALKYIRENYTAPSVRCVRMYLPSNLRVALLSTIIATRASWCSFNGIMSAYKTLRQRSPWLERLTTRPMQEQLELLRKNGLVDIKSKRNRSGWKSAMFKARMSLSEFMQSTKDDAAIAEVLQTLEQSRSRRSSSRLQ